MKWHLLFNESIGNFPVITNGNYHSKRQGSFCVCAQPMCVCLHLPGSPGCSPFFGEQCSVTYLPVFSLFFPILPAAVFRASVSSCLKYSSYSRWLIISFVVLHSLNMCLPPLDTSGTFYSRIYLHGLISLVAFLSLPLLYCYIVFLSSFLGIQLFFGVFLLPSFLANVSHWISLLLLF